MRKLLLLLFVLLMSAPLRADDAAPKFLIERIDVRNLKHVSADVVRSETRLRTGRTYSEDELRQASDRVSRLPFVLDAQFSLEKGSVRDSYVLVISVVETQRFFYAADLTQLTGPQRDVYGVRNNSLAAGLRTFVGRSSELHVGAGTREEVASQRPYRLETIEAGYTRYNLFGTNAFATFSVGVPRDENAHTAHLLPQLVVGVPLSATETLTVKFATSDIRQKFSYPDAPRGETRQARRALLLGWSRNTLDHPFAPSRGSVFSLTPLVALDDNIVPVQAIGPGHNAQFTLVPEHVTTLGLQFEAARYVALSDRNTTWLAIDGDLRKSRSRIFLPFTEGQRTFPSRFAMGEVVAGFGRSLWSAERIAKDGDARIEATLRFQRNPYIYPSNRTDSFGLFFVRRHAWGTARVGGEFVW